MALVLAIDPIGLELDVAVCPAEVGTLRLAALVLDARQLPLPSPSDACDPPSSSAIPRMALRRSFVNAW